MSTPPSTAGSDTWQDTLPALAGDVSEPPGGTPLIAGRYEPIAPIGRGHFGTVWRARDVRSDAQVALKLVPALAERDLVAARREITALRWARLPGVVRLLDEGLDGKRWFIVMELVEGTRFPGLPTPCSWEELEPVALALLEILSRLHFANLVHRDLKPDNVMVQADGRPVVLDLGIAAGEAGLPDRLRGFIGTPKYASPEQCKGGTVDARSDLFSVGVMLLEALTGFVPHKESTVRATLTRRAHARVPPVRQIAPEVPERVATVLDVLLARDPADRPGAAVDVLSALGAPLAPVLGGAGAVLDEPATSWRGLRKLFGGQDRFLHLPTDAALCLWQRTGGDPDRVQEELSAWVRAGLGVSALGRVTVARRALDRLMAGIRVSSRPHLRVADPEEQRVLDWIRLAFPQARAAELAPLAVMPDNSFNRVVQRLERRGLAWRGADALLFAGASVGPVPHWSVAQRRDAYGRLAAASAVRGVHRMEWLLEAGAAPSKVLDEAEVFARHLMRRGERHLVLRLLPRAIALAADRGEEHESRLLGLLACCAQAENTLEACNAALYAIERASGRFPELVPVMRLLRASRATFQREAVGLLPAQHPTSFEDEFLDMASKHLLVRSSPNRAVVLENLDAWSRESQVRRGLWLGWIGLERYRQGRFAESAALSAAAAEARPSGWGRTAAELNCAGALIEDGQHTEALRVAHRASRRARRHRNARHEALAACFVNAALYRSAVPAEARPRLAAEAVAVSSYVGALFSLVEAAKAWRAGARDLAAALAERACAQSRARNDVVTTDLASALFLLCGGTPDIREILGRIQSHPPEVAIQILALLEMSGMSTNHDSVQSLFRQVASTRRSGRLDILDISECQEAFVDDRREG